VDDQSWDIYHDSQWYKEQEGTPGKLNCHTCIIGFAIQSKRYCP